MIKFRLPIDGTDRTITRPVSIGVLNDIKELLFINEDVRTKLANQIDSYITNENTEPINLEDNSPRLEEIKFSVEEEINEDNFITTPLQYTDYKPILYDDDVEAFIRPIYVDTTLTFNIRYRSRSKTSVNNFLNALKLNIADNDGMTLHDIKYMFYVRPELIELFLDISILKNKVFPTNKNFEDYLIEKSDGRLTVVGGLNGNTKTMDIGVSETQLMVNGYFKSDVVSVKGEYGDDSGMYEAQLTYYLTYNKPVALYVLYPPLIYNQLIPKKYLLLRDHKTPVLENERTKPTTNTNFSNGPFLNNNRLEHSMSKVVNYEEGMVNIPNFDYFRHPLPHPNYIPIFSVLVSITLEDKRNLFNLGEIPGYKINDVFLDFIKETEYRYMTDVYNSIFLLELIDDKNIRENNSLYVDADLNISAREDLDIKRTYRVVFSLLTDMLYAKPNAVSRTLSNKIVFNKTLEALEIDTNDVHMLDRDSKIMIYNKPTSLVRYTVMNTAFMTGEK